MPHVRLSLGRGVIGEGGTVSRDIHQRDYVTQYQGSLHDFGNEGYFPGVVTLDSH